MVLACIRAGLSKIASRIAGLDRRARVAGLRRKAEQWEVAMRHSENPDEFFHWRDKAKAAREMADELEGK